jgi:hypothetical protein
LHAPVTLTADGSVTIRGRYRLTACPDLLPTLWPSPAAFDGASHTYSRLDEPQHTALALCPQSKSDAERLPGLTGTVPDTREPQVRLTWKDTGPLTVTAVGSASTVATVVPEPDCDAGCVTVVTPSRPATVQLQTVDPCPPATTDDSLVLVVSQDGGPQRTVAVDVPGLHRTLCR